MNKARCLHCMHEGTDNSYCAKCTYNPEYSAQFKTANEYYPLELKDGHINLWEEDGKTKYTIALFGDDGEDDGDVELHFVYDRPLNKRINWEHFKELIKIGYKVHNKEYSDD